MKPLWNEKNIKQATDGDVSGHWLAGRVVIDSRNVQLGDLFVAIKGERVDGHDYIADALARGAVAVIASRIPENIPRGTSLVLVEDTIKALVAMARFARSRSAAKIVGVTGSVGKTSAKEMIRLALSAHGKTHATIGNYNNHIGLPLSLANMPEDAKFGVFELGMNHAGEINFLAEILRPHVAVITNIEAVHLEFFKDIQGIAEAKAEIFEHVEKLGRAIINADNKFADYLRDKASNLSVITFGEAEKSNSRLISYSPTATGAEIIATVQGETISFPISAIGKHFATTAVCALAVASAFSLPLPKTAATFIDFSEGEGRGKIIPLAVSGGGQALLVDDSYNASPASMKAAFAKVDEIWKIHNKKGRKIAILGDMLELGNEAAALHASLAEQLILNGFNLIFTAGALMQHLSLALPSEIRGQHMPNPQQLLLRIKETIKPDDIILIKGSHGSKIYELSRQLATSNH